MTIEKEANDCVYQENNPMYAFWKSICDEHPCIGEELESIRFRINKSLQAKQDRIDKLESALKYYANMKVVCTHDDPLWCEHCPDGGKRAKKAIGGGNEGD